MKLSIKMNAKQASAGMPAKASRHRSLRPRVIATPQWRSVSNKPMGSRSFKPLVVTRAKTETSDSESVALKVALGGGTPAAAIAASAALIHTHVLVDPLTAYFNTIGVPVINFLNPPEWVIHWFHGLNMATVLFAMGGYGTYLGYKIRAGEGNEAAFGGETMRELHPKLMGGMLFFFFLGGQGGLVFTLMENRNLLESPHAVSALAGLGLLGAQAALGVTMKGKASARTAHTYLGTGLMALFFVHAGLGLTNGLSF